MVLHLPIQVDALKHVLFWHNLFTSVLSLNSKPFTLMELP